MGFSSTSIAASAEGTGRLEGNSLSESGLDVLRSGTKSDPVASSESTSSLLKEGISQLRAVHYRQDRRTYMARLFFDEVC
jgi:hypothetical protein